MKTKLLILFFFLSSYTFVFSQSTENINIELGVPKGTDSSNDYIIKREQYVLSFNKERHTANWVSWNLNKSWFGKAKRYNKFIADPDLTEGYYQAVNKDYLKSGYDKGHTVRSEERTNSKLNNKTTFYFTNMMPQRPDLNRGVWLKFERYCENLCKKEDKELFIIAGGIYHDGYKTLKNNVAVPDSCYKIIVILNRGEGLNDVNINTKVVSVVMPNKKGIRKAKWEKYTTTVRRIEWSTGYDFLSNVKKDIQDVIENE